MYKLNKNYKGQNVTCYFPDGSCIRLDIATDKEFEKVYKVKGYQKFIDVDKRKKEFKDVKK